MDMAGKWRAKLPAGVMAEGREARAMQLPPQLASTVGTCWAQLVTTGKGWDGLEQASAALTAAALAFTSADDEVLGQQARKGRCYRAGAWAPRAR